MTTDQQLYEQWREDYALEYEPNYDEHLEAYCMAAFQAGIEAERDAHVVPDAYLVYAKGSTRYWVVTLNPDDVPEIYKGGETIPLYKSHVVPNPTQEAQVQLPEPEATVHSKLGTTCMFPSSNMRKGDKIYTEHQVMQLLKRN